MLHHPMHHQVRRAERLKGLGDRIAELWDRLKVPDGEREAFSASVDGEGGREYGRE